MTKVLPSFYRGREASINNLPITNGAIYVATDTRNLFFDVSNDTRIKISGDGGNLDISDEAYTKDEIDTLFQDILDNYVFKVISYEVTLKADGWLQEGDYYLYYYDNDLLALGKDGIISPLVTYTDVNREEYHYIYDANATRGEGIVFRAVLQPTEDIDIIITDFGQFIDQTEKVLISIYIQKPPTKVLYKSGEDFDPSGMIVIAKYRVVDKESTIAEVFSVINSRDIGEFRTKEVHGYDWSPKILRDNDNSVVISYTEEEVTVTTELKVSVIPVLQTIEMVSKPDKLTYNYGEELDLTGMEIRAHYTNGTQKDVTDFVSVIPESISSLDYGEHIITIQYEDREITFYITIEADKLKVPSQYGTLTYNKNSQSPTWKNYNRNSMEISGTTEATDAGTYYVTFTPKDGFVWDDDTSEEKTVEWVIEKATITEVPEQSGTLYYNGAQQSPSWNNYDEEKMLISEEPVGIEVGTYEVMFSATKNYKWEDGSDTKIVTWRINEVLIDLPTLNGELIFNGHPQSPSWNNYDSSILDISGVITSTDAGRYTAIFTPKLNYSWSDGTSGEKTATWEIKVYTINIVPTQNGVLTYNCATQFPSWNNYDSTYLDIDGTLLGTDAGEYEATFTPNKNCVWSDLTTGPKTVNWTIEKAIGIITVEETNIEIPIGETYSLYFQYNGEDLVAVVGADYGYISMAPDYANNRIDFTGKAEGITVFTLLVFSETNYTLPEPITIKISVTDDSWEWGSLTEAGAGNEKWWKGLQNFLSKSTTSEIESAITVGMTKSVTLSSSVLGTTTHLVEVIGVNHDAEKTITFSTKNCLAESVLVKSFLPLTAGDLAYDSGIVPYYDNFPGKDYIKEIVKNACLKVNGLKDNLPTTSLYIPVWILSESELGISLRFAPGEEFTGGEGLQQDEHKNVVTTPYPRFTSNNSRLKKAGDNGNNYVSYFTRSIYYSYDGVRDLILGVQGASSTGDFYKAQYLDFLGSLDLILSQGTISTTATKYNRKFTFEVEFLSSDATGTFLHAWGGQFSQTKSSHIYLTLSGQKITYNFLGNSIYVNVPSPFVGKHTVSIDLYNHTLTVDGTSNSMTNTTKPAYSIGTWIFGYTYNISSDSYINYLNKVRAYSITIDRPGTTDYTPVVYEPGAKTTTSGGYKFGFVNFSASTLSVVGTGFTGGTNSLLEIPGLTAPFEIGKASLYLVPCFVV